MKKFMEETAFTRLKPHLVALLILGGLLCLVYLPSLRHEFIFNWDDNLYVMENEAVKGFSFAHIKEAFSNNYVGNYAPLQIMSYMLDYSLFGQGAFGFILMNLVWHTLNGVLLYLLLMKLYDNPTAVFTGTALFLLHPVQVESVVWVSQRKNLLAMFFFLVSLHYYLKYYATDKPQSHRYYIFSIIGFAAALLTKSVTVIMPLILLLYNSCFFRNETLRRRLLKLAPYFLLAFIFAVITYYSQSAEYLGGGRTGFHGGGKFYTMLTMMTVLLRYIRMLFWPLSLCVGYQVPVKTGFDAEVLLATVVILLLTAFAVYLYRLRKDLFLWYCIFFIGLIPVSQIIPIVTLMNDRYLYFPMLGAAGLCAAATDSNRARLKLFPGYLLYAPVGLALLAFSHLSWQQAKTWQDALTLWTHAIKVAPQKALNWHYLGRAFYADGQLDKSIAAYQRALVLEGNNCAVQNDLASAYLDKKDLSAAAKYLQHTTVICPDFIKGWINQGYSYLLQDDLNQAEHSYQKALELKPDYPPGLIGLATINLLRKKPEAALHLFKRSGIKESRDPSALYNYACAAALAGRAEESLDYLQCSIRFGFKDVTKISEDDDFNSLRSLERFKSLVEMLKKERF